MDIVLSDPSLFIAQEAGCVRELSAIGLVKIGAGNGATIHDFGQNVAGSTLISVKGDPGATVSTDFAEVLGSDRAFDRRNYRSARAALNYVLTGSDDETWEPIVTFRSLRNARVRVERMRS